MLEIFLIFGGKDSIPHDLCSSLICDAAEIQNEHLCTPSAEQHYWQSYKSGSDCTYMYSSVFDIAFVKR